MNQKGFLLLFLFFGSSLSLNLLIAHSSSYVSDVQRKLSAYFNVTLFAAATATPTMSYLSQFDVVFAFSDGTYQDPITLGNNLASFVDGGKGVVLAMFDFGGASFSDQLQGRFVNYLAITPSTFVSGTQQTLVPLITGHPLLHGVSSFSGGTASYRGGIWGPLATKVAQWSDGRPLIGARSIAGVNRVDLAFYPPSSDIRSDFWSSTTNGVAIMVNAVNYVSNSGACGSFSSCSSCTKGGCQWCLDTNVCSTPNFTCEDRVTIPSNCPLTCSSFSSCSTCVDASNGGGCSWCLTTNTCISHQNSPSCSDVINHKNFCPSLLKMKLLD